MDPVSAVVSGLSLTIITIVSVLALVNHERMRRSLNNQVKEVVDQINDTQYYAYKFDVKQEDNLKHFDASLKETNDKINVTNKNLADKTTALTGEISRVEKASVSKESLTKGVPYLRAGEIQLGNQYLLSEKINNKELNEEAQGWLNVLNRQGTEFAGGVVTKNIKALDGATLKGTVKAPGLLDVQGKLQIAGGDSEYNKENLMTQFPAADMKNYIRGDTKIQGNTSTAGDISIGRNMNVDGRIHFKDQAFDTKSSRTNNTDSFYMEKKTGNTASSLRLTVNDTADNNFEIWGDACGLGNCNGEGSLAHRFTGGGGQWSKGDVTAAGSISGKKVATGSKTWMKDDGSIYSDAKLGVGVLPSNMGEYKLGVDGGKPGQWNAYFRNGPTSTVLANGAGQGLRIDSGKGGSEAALSVYSANGELLNVQNNGVTRIGRADGVGETKIMSTNTNIKRHIDSWSDDKALYAGWNGKKVVLGNANGVGSDDFQKNKVPAQDVVVSTNPHYIQKTLKVGKTKDDAYPNNWDSGIHTSFLYANNTIGAGKNGQPPAAYMNSDGDIYTSKGALTGSDIRLKEDVKGLTREEIDNVSHLRPVSYNLKADDEKRRKYGFIAQEVEKVYPTMVSENKDGIKAVNYDAFVPLVVGNINDIKRTVPNSKQICIGDTCITEQDLIKLKRGT